MLFGLLSSLITKETDKCVSHIASFMMKPRLRFNIFLHYFVFVLGFVKEKKVYESKGIDVSYGGPNLKSYMDRSLIFIVL